MAMGDPLALFSPQHLHIQAVDFFRFQRELRAREEKPAVLKFVGSFYRRPFSDPQHIFLEQIQHD